MNAFKLLRIDFDNKYKSDVDYIYYKGKSLNINVYNKAEQLTKMIGIMLGLFQIILLPQKNFPCYFFL